MARPAGQKGDWRRALALAAFTCSLLAATAAIAAERRRV